MSPMQQPARITFRDIEHSEAIETRVRERVAKLEEFYDRITSCHVVLSSPHHSHHQGRIYHVHIDLVVPGHEIVISRDNDKNHAHEDVYIAIRDAFNVAERQLREYARRQKGQ